MDWTPFFQVFDFPAVMYALTTGVIFGGGPLLYMTLRYPSKFDLSAKQMGLLAFAAAATAGTLFFAGQIVQAYSWDTHWARALARATLWEIFSAGLALGLGFTRSFAYLSRQDDD